MSPAKAFRAKSDAAGCYSAYFSNKKFSYQHICGKVVGYQKGTPDGYYTFAYTTYPSKAIDGPWVSLTYGTPRKHLFTYASGYSSDCSYSRINCPCARYPGDNPPTYVQGDYYCESGSIGCPAHGTVYATDPLWDGKACSTGITVAVHRLACHGSTEMCVSKINEPVKARICRDQVYFDKGILVKDLELYTVKTFILHTACLGSTHCMAI